MFMQYFHLMSTGGHPGAVVCHMTLELHLVSICVLQTLVHVDHLFSESKLPTWLLVVRQNVN